jgi:tetrahydromethanopterin S-methyltransferase subunit G
MGQIEVTRADFVRLEDRVSAVEHEVDGEKLVSRYILTQSRQNGDDLAVLKSRVDRVEQKVDRVEAELIALRKELPTIVAEAMRDVLKSER